MSRFSNFGVGFLELWVDLLVVFPALYAWCWLLHFGCDICFVGFETLGFPGFWVCALAWLLVCTRVWVFTVCYGIDVIQNFHVFLVCMLVVECF